MTGMRVVRGALALATAALLLGCGTADERSAPLADDERLRADCEQLVPEFCSLPFPSSRFLSDDASTPTGYRVTFGDSTLPERMTAAGGHLDPTPYATRDGFSVQSSIIAYLPGATAAGLAAPDAIGRSLEHDSPTVVVDLATGERVPHIAELDRSTDDDDARTLLIRPVQPLAPDTRYGVAIRGVVDANGHAVAPSAVFRALRDGSEHGHPQVEARRDEMRALFTTLADAGVARDTLQLAWQFHTGSEQNATGWLLHARDDAFAITGDDGPEYVIDSVEEDVSEWIGRRIRGRMTVPRYLERDEPGSPLRLGADELPEAQGTMQQEFLVLVPKRARDEGSLPVLQYGHGIFGSREKADTPHIHRLADEQGFVVLAVDWIGMNEPAVAPVLDHLTSGDIAGLRSVQEGLVQGLVSAQLALRMARRRLVSDPALAHDGASLIDPSDGYYLGHSQGGILGSTYMATTLDVKRGVVDVGGQSFNLMLNRSKDFQPFFTFIRLALRDGADIQVALALLQLMWDRTDPSYFSSRIARDPFAGTPPHELLMTVAIGDHQVPDIASHALARAVGAVNVVPAPRSIWGVPESTNMEGGAAMIEFDFGAPPVPQVNLPPSGGFNGHNALLIDPRVHAIWATFLREGRIETPCDGPCVFEEPTEELPE